MEKQQLGLLRQFLSESERKIWTSEELYTLFDTFVPLMSQKTQKDLISKLKQL